ncbi:M28 family peptidase [bacterium]|nr:M28 family peptidase [bacterium]
MIKFLRVFLILSLFVAGWSATAAPSQTLMSFLTSPEIAGREAGTPEAERVADTLAARFAQIGLQPAGTNGYFLPFRVEVPRLDSTQTRARFYLEGESDESGYIEAVLGTNLFFFPRHGQSAVLTVPLLDGGFGIVAPEFGREDYTPQSAEGKILLIRIGAPSDSMFMRGSAGFRYSLRPVKARIAEENGALAVIFVQATGDSGRLEKEVEKQRKDFDPRPLQLPGTHPMPVLYLDVVTGERLQRKCRDNSGELVADLKLTFAMGEPLTLRNVAGILPGSDPKKAGEYILVGAHYDHLGRRGNTFYPGADDNASGIVALLSAAEDIAANPPALSVLFVCFDGEEKGLLGSKWLVDNLPAVDKVTVMVNLDDVGRSPSGHAPMGSPLKIDDSELTVFYSQQSPWIEEALNPVAEKQSLKVAWDPRPVFHEFSDHASFHAKGIPALFFFSGAHGDYHSPTDTPDKIEWELLDRRVIFLTECLQELGNRDAVFSFESPE